MKTVKKFTIKEFVEKAKKIHGDKYDYTNVNYFNNRIKVSIVCPQHGEFFQSPEKHLVGRGCSICGGSYKKWGENQFVEKSIEVHGNKYCYDEVNYINGVTPVKIKCKIHGLFFATPGNHLSGKECGKCAGNTKLNTAEFIEKSLRVHGNKYNYSQSVYGKNNEEKVTIICPIHGKFSQAPYHHLFGQGCAKCISNISKKEQKFLDFIKIPDTAETRQKRILQFKVDGINLETNTIYEFLGDYWHGNPKRFDFDDINKKCHKTFGELYNNTTEKLKRLKKCGFNVKYIWESEWDTWESPVSPIPIKEYSCTAKL